MCLRTNETGLLIAEDNILCYKFLDNWEDHGILTSPYRGEKYLINEPNREVELDPQEDVFLDDSKPYTFYHQGYHSYNMKTFNYRKLLQHHYRQLYLCSIPKGSKYQYGLEGDIVSSNITILKEIKVDLSFKIKNFIQCLLRLKVI